MTSTTSSSTSSCEFTLLTHIRRAFMCQILMANPTKHETTSFNKKDITYNEAVRSYYVWRRSGLLFSLPFILFGMVFGLMDLVSQLTDDDTNAVFNGFGKLLIVIQNVDTTVLFIGVVTGFVWWNQLRKSVRVVGIAFILSFVMPLLPALFPLEMTLKKSIRGALDDDEARANVFSIKIGLSFQYMLTLLPVIISLPGGALRAALRIRWLLSESMLSGWILIMSASFYSILLCIGLIVVLQVAGNYVMFVGTVFVVIAPWFYVIRGRLFVHLWTEEMKKKVLLTQFISGIVTLSGYVLILYFAFTAEVSGVGLVGNSTPNKAFILTVFQGFRILLETIGRLIITTIMLCDVLLKMNLENWQESETSKLKYVDEMKEQYQIFIGAFGQGTDNTSNSGTRHTDATENP